MSFFVRGFLAFCLVAVVMAQPASDALRAVSLSTSQFSNDFTQKVAEKEKKNLITSPLSANLVLAMAAFGARGTTLKQFRDVLHLPTPDTLAQSGYQQLIDRINNVQGVTLSIANKMFVNKNVEVKDSYKALTTNNFRSTSESVNFNNPNEAAEIINGWVKQQTNDRIKGIVNADSLDPSTALLLANAVYFKGLWKHKFNPEETFDRPFYVNGETMKNVPTMTRTLNTRYTESPELGAKILELPYKGDEMSMIIILPDAVNGLPEVERKLANLDLNQLLAEASTREVVVFLPKFKIETELDLGDSLQNMGLTEMFSTSADFSGIADAPLYVSKVVQKAFIEVNEEGSEAAGATGIQIMTYSLVFPEQFTADHPFAYRIVHIDEDRKANVRKITPIFTGHVVEPKIE